MQKETIDREELRHKNQISFYKKAILWIIILFLVIFGYKTVRTLLSEVSPQNTNYVNYVGCINSYTEYDLEGQTKICEERGVVNELVITRLLSHFITSIWIPLILMMVVIYLIKEENKIYTGSNYHKIKK